MRFLPRAALALLVLALFVFSASTTPPGNGRGPASAEPASSPSPTAISTHGSSVVPATGPNPLSTPGPKAAFDQRIHDAASALERAGIPPQRIRLPYDGPSAEIVGGVVVPGDALPSGEPAGGTSLAPAPSGLAYYGENDTSGTVEATTVDASSVAGSLTVNQLSTLYVDTDTPDFWGIQLNSFLTNVTLQGTPGYTFWTQNAVDYIQHNQTLSFGEDTWNFSGYPFDIATDNSTIQSHNPNGSVIAGLYIGEGPYLYAPRPFSLALYLNSSVTGRGEQELWYNYTLSTPGGHRTSGNYDWLIFNSTNPSHPATVGIAPFEASGTSVSPVGISEDFELDFGIGSFDGSTMDVLAANATATLDYCPSTIATCSLAEFQSVPAAEDFGSETGETSSGLNIAYSGTEAIAAAGPFILRGLWGFGGAPGSAAGATEVANRITVSGDPDGATSTPYVFVFFNTTAAPDTTYEWAPDVPAWYLAPGTYHYELMLADYAEQNGTLVVGRSPTSLTAVLSFDLASGVYTPLWALNDSELGGISASGNGTLSNQYDLFNNPTASCTACDGTPDGSVSDSFGAWNDYFFPTFAGILLYGTDAYVDVNQPVNFSVDASAVVLLPGLSLYLQLEFVSTQHVTLAHDALAGGWPLMFGIETLAGAVPASTNPFPQANVVLWNSTGDLVLSNTFVPAATIPYYMLACVSNCPPYCGPACAPPDELLLFGGTRNTVWGNLFEDATGLYAQPPPFYAGVAESESGDLIYNNNFSVDNPTAYLPYNIYFDACPDGYAGGCGPGGLASFEDTWNVTPAPVAVPLHTVNGYPLSGNILGSTCTFQGGNYWSNYGNALNPYSLLPYGDIFNYTDLAGTLPPGALLINRSIGVGGDFAPLTLANCASFLFYPVSFQADGLPAGSAWQVEIDSYLENATGNWDNLTLPNGTYPFSVRGPAGYTPSPSSGNLTVDGIPAGLVVTFSGYGSVVFTETGLSGGTPWSVTLDGVTQVSATDQVGFANISDGNHTYQVGAVPGYTVGSPTGSILVEGGPAFETIQFTPIPPAEYLVKFFETGLAGGVTWSVTLGGVARSSPSPSNITFEETNGVYAFSIESVTGYVVNTTAGSLTLAGHATGVAVGFSAITAPPHNSTASGGGIPTVDWVLAGAGLGVAAIAAVLLLQRRTSPPAG